MELPTVIIFVYFKTCRGFCWREFYLFPFAFELLLICVCFPFQKSTPFSPDKDLLRKKRNQFNLTLDPLISWVMETKTRINITKDLPPTERERVHQNIMVIVKPFSRTWLDVFSCWILKKKYFKIFAERSYRSRNGS